jgi:hypothetical protein
VDLITFVLEAFEHKQLTVVGATLSGEQAQMSQMFRPEVAVATVAML